MPRDRSGDLGPEGTGTGVVVLESERPATGSGAHYGRCRSQPDAGAPECADDKEVAQHLAPGAVGTGEHETRRLPGDPDEPPLRRGIVGDEEGIQPAVVEGAVRVG